MKTTRGRVLAVACVVALTVGAFGLVSVRPTAAQGTTGTPLRCETIQVQVDGSWLSCDGFVSNKVPSGHWVVVYDLVGALGANPVGGVGMVKLLEYDEADVPYGEGLRLTWVGGSIQVHSLTPLVVLAPGHSLKLWNIGDGSYVTLSGVVTTEPPTIYLPAVLR